MDHYQDNDSFYNSVAGRFSFDDEYSEEVTAFDRGYIPDIEENPNHLSYDAERDSLRKALTKTIKEFMGVESSTGHRVDYELKNGKFIITFVFYQQGEFSYEELFPGVDYERFEFSVDTKFDKSFIMKGLTQLSVKKMSVELSNAIRTHCLNLETCLEDAQLFNLVHYTFCGKVICKDADTKVSFKPYNLPIPYY